MESSTPAVPVWLRESSSTGSSQRVELAFNNSKVTLEKWWCTEQSFQEVLRTRKATRVSLRTSHHLQTLLQAAPGSLGSSLCRKPSLLCSPKPRHCISLSLPTQQLESTNSTEGSRPRPAGPHRVGPLEMGAREQIYPRNQLQHQPALHCNRICRVWIHRSAFGAMIFPSFS